MRREGPGAFDTPGLLTRIGWRSVSRGWRLPGADTVRKYLDNAYLAALLADLRVGCLLDVGANVGQFAAKVRAMGYRGHIVSFEPIPAVAAVLARRAAADPRWHVRAEALGDEDGVRDFHVIGADATVLSSFLVPSLADMPAERATVAVPIRRLDGIADELRALVGRDARIFLKMDTQGFDLDVARGARATLPHIVGLQSELSVSPLYHGQPTYTEALAFFEAAGFGLMDLALVNRTPAGGVLEYDALFARTNELAPSRRAR